MPCCARAHGCGVRPQAGVPLQQPICACAWPTPRACFYLRYCCRCRCRRLPLLQQRPPAHAPPPATGLALVPLLHPRCPAAAAAHPSCAAAPKNRRGWRAAAGSGRRAPCPAPPAGRPAQGAPGRGGHLAGGWCGLQARLGWRTVHGTPAWRTACLCLAVQAQCRLEPGTIHALPHLGRGEDKDGAVEGGGVLVHWRIDLGRGTKQPATSLRACAARRVAL